MVEAKRKYKQKKEYLDEAKKHLEKFNSFKQFPAFTFSRDEKLHAIKAYHHLMGLIFIRAKHIHKAIIDAIDVNNSYVSFTLLKAYAENVPFLAYMYITAKNLIKNKDYKKLLNLTTTHALGGKKFPPADYLREKGLRREDFQQTNLLTWMQKMDKDFNKSIGEGKNISEFEKLYNEFLAEAGHSTFLGVSICEVKQNDGTLIPKVDKTYQTNDDLMTLNHLSLCSIYFFYYWDRFNDDKSKQFETIYK